MAANPNTNNSFETETMADIEAKYQGGVIFPIICDVSGVFADILDERTRQDGRWGGAHHDDRHRLPDWNALVDDYSRQGLNALHDARPNDWRRRMVQVAALAVAAIESFDRTANARADFVETSPAVLDGRRPVLDDRRPVPHPDEGVRYGSADLREGF